MKAREALIVWNDQEVKVTKLGSRDDEERFPNSGGAAYEYWQEATNFDRLLLYVFAVLTVEFRIDPRVVDDESRGGISPPRAPRTVHEPLDSHGSRCPAVAMA